jgi:hypothetical protein
MYSTLISFVIVILSQLMFGWTVLIWGKLHHGTMCQFEYCNNRYTLFETIFRNSLYLRFMLQALIRNHSDVSCQLRVADPTVTCVKPLPAMTYIQLGTASNAADAELQTSLPFVTPSNGTMGYVKLCCVCSGTHSLLFGNCSIMPLYYSICVALSVVTSSFYISTGWPFWPYPT